MRIVGPRATAAALPFDRLIEALRALFASGCVVPPRHVQQPADGMTSLIMPAWMPGGPYAVKIVNIAPGNSAAGLPGLHSTVLLHDGATGRPLALIDGDTVTARRIEANGLQVSGHGPRRLGCGGSCCQQEWLSA